MFFIWGGLVIFFPIIVIDGKLYSQKTIRQVKTRYSQFFKEKLDLLNTEAGGVIKSNFARYMNNLGSQIPFTVNDRSLENHLKNFYANINLSEKQFMAELDFILQNETQLFSVPLQVKNITKKEDIFNDIFSVCLTNYLIDGHLYDKTVMNMLIEELNVFRQAYPLAARKIIEEKIDSYYEQVLGKLQCYVDISEGIECPLRDTILFLRQQGETLDPFECLLQECDTTDLAKSRYIIREPIDVSPFAMPILLPVSVIGNQIYDASAIQAIEKNISALRNDWEHLRNDSYTSIINGIQKTINNNLASYTDIDENISIEELPELIAYYMKQQELSAELFTLGVEQCLLPQDSVETYQNEPCQELNVSPLEIELVTVENTVYDMLAFNLMTEGIALIRSGWLDCLNLEKEKININIREKLQGYYRSLVQGQEVTFNDEFPVIEYLIIQSNISEELFSYFYECCGTPVEYDVAEVGTSNINLDTDKRHLAFSAIEMDEELYYAPAVKVIEESMRNLASTIVTDIRVGLSSIINIKTDQCLNNIDPYLAWYFDWLADDILTVAWRGLKSVFSDYSEAKELLEKYREHFYPMIEMGNDIQEYLLKYNTIINDLSLCFVMTLETFHIEPTLTDNVEQTLTGNDFMKPYQTAPDYIKSFVANSRRLLELSVVKTDTELVNAIRIAANTGADVGIDFAGAAIGGAIGGPPGSVIGFAVSIIAGIAVNAGTSKAVEKAKYDEYKMVITSSFERNRRALLAVL